MIEFRLGERITLERLVNGKTERIEGIVAQFQMSQKVGHGNLYHVTMKFHERTDHLKVPLIEIVKSKRANEDSNKNASGNPGNGIPDVRGIRQES